MQNFTGKELKRLLDSTRNPPKLGWVGIVSLVVWAAVLSVWLFDPFGWLDGTPAVHEAKKWIVFCIDFIWIPVLAGVWFLIVRPLQTGVATGGSKYQAPYRVRRSEEPKRFAVEIWCNVLILIIGFAVAVWTLSGFIRDLQKAKAESAKQSVATGAAIK